MYYSKYGIEALVKCYFMLLQCYCYGLEFRVYLGVKTCEILLCFVAIVRVRVYYVDVFVFIVLCHW